MWAKPSNLSEWHIFFTREKETEIHVLRFWIKLKDRDFIPGYFEPHEQQLHWKLVKIITAPNRQSWKRYVFWELAKDWLKWTQAEVIHFETLEGKTSLSHTLSLSHSHEFSHSLSQLSLQLCIDWLFEMCVVISFVALSFCCSSEPGSLQAIFIDYIQESVWMTNPITLTGMQFSFDLSISNKNLKVKPSCGLKTEERSIQHPYQVF